MAYTAHDTPAVVARIEADLDHVRRTVRTGDPGLRSLVLTGGFARGEGSVRGGEPQNDYDLVALRHTFAGPSPTPYATMQKELEADLGLHMDLAPVRAGRLPWVSRSIFWYETALRGQTLWGDDLLGRIRVRDPARIRPGEGMRLLVNRAAGLLLATAPNTSDHDQRIQASKALLAVLDTHLLATGHFAPSQTERWTRYQELDRDGAAPEGLDPAGPWIHWAFRFKTRPDDTPPVDPHEAWPSAARALLDTVPVALRHAGHSTLEHYAATDTLLDRIHYWHHARTVPGARRRARNPTGNVRAATIHLLDASLAGTAPGPTPAALPRTVPAARIHLERLVTPRKIGEGPGDTLGLLEALRRATLQ